MKVMQFKVETGQKVLDLKVILLVYSSHSMSVEKISFTRTQIFPSTAAMQGHNGDVAAMSLHPSQEGVFVTGSVDKTARLWDLRFNYNSIKYTSKSYDIKGTVLMETKGQFLKMKTKTPRTMKRAQNPNKT